MVVVQCEKCQARFRVDPQKVKPGTRVRCAKCKHSFVFILPETSESPSLQITALAENPMPTSEPPPPPKIQEPLPKVPPRRTVAPTSSINLTVKEQASRIALVLGLSLLGFLIGLMLVRGTS